MRDDYIFLKTFGEARDKQGREINTAGTLLYFTGERLPVLLLQRLGEGVIKEVVGAPLPRPGGTLGFQLASHRLDSWVCPPLAKVPSTYFDSWSR